jgi:hypothetical protein
MATKITIADLKLPQSTKRFLKWSPEILDSLGMALPDELISTFNDVATGRELSYIKWIDIEALLNAVVPGWKLVITEETKGAKWFQLYGYLDIYGVRRDNVGYYDVDAPNSMDGGANIPPGTIARASLLRRCAASFGLGAYLYRGEDHTAEPQVNNLYAIRDDQASELEQLLVAVGETLPATAIEQMKSEGMWTIEKANKYIAYLRRRVTVPDVKASA